MLLHLDVDHIKLLDVLSKMYSQLTEYPDSLAQLKMPANEAPAFAWLDPLDENTSLYGEDVSIGILTALESCDLYLLDKYLKELCHKEGTILKRQRGNSYGFGDDPNSDEYVTKQLTPGALKKAPTYTKQIENLYGTEDMILTRFGVQAFNKSQDDLLIKYSADLLDKYHDWNTKKMKSFVRELDALQNEFSDSQKDLLNAGVTTTEDIQLTTQNIIHRIVEQCRRSHNGPISSETVLDQMLETFSEDNAYEIRYMKFTLLNIKDSSPLFCRGTSMSINLGQT